jgi:hypothetical protein
VRIDETPESHLTDCASAAGDSAGARTNLRSLERSGEEPPEPSPVGADARVQLCDRVHLLDDTLCEQCAGLVFVCGTGLVKHNAGLPPSSDLTR